MINLIVAKASNDIIGKDNSLLWHLSEDLKYFKRITLGKTVLMGRKTWSRHCPHWKSKKCSALVEQASTLNFCHTATASTSPNFSNPTKETSLSPR